MSQNSTPNSTPKSKKQQGEELREKMTKIMRATPTINKSELANLCNVSLDVIKYQLKKLKEEIGVHWEGHSLNGRWVWDQEARGRPE